MLAQVKVIAICDEQLIFGWILMVSPVAMINRCRRNTALQNDSKVLTRLLSFVSSESIHALSIRTSWLAESIFLFTELIGLGSSFPCCFFDLFHASFTRSIYFLSILIGWCKRRLTQANVNPAYKAWELFERSDRIECHVIKNKIKNHSVDKVKKL